MLIQLDINDKNADFFLQYLHSLKEGIVENIVIQKENSKSFEVGSIDAVQKRLYGAEQNAEYIEHDAFWNEMGIH